MDEVSACLRERRWVHWQLRHGTTQGTYMRVRGRTLNTKPSRMSGKELLAEAQRTEGQRLSSLFKQQFTFSCVCVGAFALRKPEFFSDVCILQVGVDRSAAHRKLVGQGRISHLHHLGHDVPDSVPDVSVHFFYSCRPSMVV